MPRRYIAQCRDIENHDPIESGSPRGVWNQLQKATGRDRKWLQDFGWRVKLKPEPTPAPEPLDLTESMMMPIEPIESPYYEEPKKRGWIGVALVFCLLFWAALYYFWIR